MAKHPVNITVLDNAVGIPSPEDGIMMIFIKAVAVALTFSLDHPYLITDPIDLEPLGIDAAYDLANGTNIVRNITNFYAEAGSGAQIWLVGVAKATLFSAYVATDTFADAVRFTDEADPLMRAKMIGFSYATPVATQAATDFLQDALDLITPLQAAQLNMFNLGYPFSCIVDGSNMKTGVSVTTLGTMANKSAGSVSFCCVSLVGDGAADVGFALGRAARISVGHGFGAVEDGPRNTNLAFLTNGIKLLQGTDVVTGKVYFVYGGTVVYNGATYLTGQSFVAVDGQTDFVSPDDGYVLTGSTPIQKLRPAEIDSLGEKQYFFLRKWARRSGFYWNDAGTCEDPTKQLSSQEYNRVANRLSAEALDFFIDTMGANLPLDVSTGAVSQVYLTGKQGQFKTENIDPLSVASGSGDLTDGELILTGPNFNATKTMLFKIKIVPTPIMGEADGTIEFTSTLP